ncbi:MAG: pseudouridine synthase [Acholeplasma sp.]
MRLDKFLSNLKYGSRKEIRIMVKKGLVTINGVTASSSDVQIDPNYDKIFLNGEAVFYKENITLAFYKPVGYLSSHQSELYPTLFSLIEAPYHQFDLKIAGRLDYDSEGLVILTTNGDLIHQITHPKKHVKKIYEATLDQPFTKMANDWLMAGIELKDEDGSIYQTSAIELAYKDNIAIITIDEGKFHQVKKMFAKVGFQVINLKRLQIGQLKLDLKPGCYKEIEESDIFER